MFYEVGYCLVQKKPLQWREQAIEVLTPSACLNDVLPDPWCLSWTGQGPELHTELHQTLGVDAALRQRIQRWGDRRFELDWGWPHLFFSLDSALNFREHFVPHLPCECLGLFLPADWREVVLEDQSPQSPQTGKTGLCWMLEKSLPEPPGGEFLGFDVLGLELGGGFHSMHCNDLPEDYQQDLGLALNDRHLLASLHDAEQAADYTARPESGAEPVLWVPMKLKRWESKHEKAPSNFAISKNP